MIRKVYGFIAGILILLLVGGCSQKKQAVQKNEETEIHIASWNNAADNLSEIAKKYNEKHPGSKVIIDYADSSYTKLRATLAAGNGIPDIFQVQGRDIASFYTTYGLQDFSDISDIITSDAGNWVDFALGPCLADDGKYYAIPWDIGPVGIFYRTDIFKKAGIDVNSLTTWDKYIEAGKKIRSLGNYYMEATTFNGSNTTSTTTLMLYLNELNGQYYDMDGKVDLASPAMISTMNLLLKMIKADVILDIPTGWDDRITAINDNRLVAFPYPAWYMGTLKNSCSNLSGKWAIAQLPAFIEGRNRYSNVGGSVLAVSASTKNLKLCKDFLIYAMKSNDGNDINMKYGEFPSYKPAYQTDYFKSTDKYFSNLPVGEVFAQLTGAPRTNWGAYFTDILQSMGTPMGDIILNHADPQTTLKEASREAQNKINAK